MNIKTIKIGENLLAKNDAVAEENARFLKQRGIASFNVMGTPGAGKTRLLENLLPKLNLEFPCAVVEGDIAGAFDSERLQKFNLPVIQINTEGACHLEAFMIKQALSVIAGDSEAIPFSPVIPAATLKSVTPADSRRGRESGKRGEAVPSLKILFVENVGNLVCPAEFALGIAKNIIVSSVTEGDDKPAKYPLMYKISHLCVLNKADLLDPGTFNVEKFTAYAEKVNPSLEIIQVSSKTGRNIDKVVHWLLKNK